MFYANEKLFKSQEKLSAVPCGLLWSQGPFINTELINFSLGAQCLNLAPGVQLDFWWYDRYLLLSFRWWFVLFLGTSIVSSPSTIVPDGLGPEESKRDPYYFSRIRLQRQTHTSSRFSSGKVKMGQVNASACLFSPAVKPGRLGCAQVWVYFYFWK